MKHIKKLITFILIAAMACTVLLSGCSGGGKNINLDDYVTVSFDGYDGYGTARSSIDFDKISADYDGKVKVKSGSWIYEGYTVGEILSDAVSASVDPSSGLSNGDTVTVKWDVDESYIEDALNCKVSYNSAEYTVDGLEEIGTVDVFEGVDVTFSGLAPNGEASVVSTGEFGTDGYSMYTWDISPSNGLSNGDTVTVIFTPGNDFVNKYGATPEYTEKEFTVSGLDSDVTDAAELSDENMAVLESEAKDQLDAYVLGIEDINWTRMLDMEWTGSCDVIHDEFELQNIYLYEPKDSDAYLWSWDIPAGTLIFVYKLPVTVETNSSTWLGTTGATKSGDVYFAVEFTNLSIEGNGNLVGYTDNTVNVYGSYDELYTTWVTENKDNYYITVYNADRSVAE